MVEITAYRQVELSSFLTQYVVFLFFLFLLWGCGFEYSQLFLISSVNNNDPLLQFDEHWQSGAAWAGLIPIFFNVPPTCFI